MSRGRPEGLSKSQIDKLGKRLSGSEAASEEDLRALEQVRLAHEPVLQEVVAELRSLGLAVSARLKTTGTIIDKLKQRTALSRMQDIAGCRIVASLTLEEQDNLVSRILRRFPGSKVVDRRRDPSHGYRAVHIVVTRDGHHVEIQVRTELQNRWAQLFERLADSWGRQIRYGGLPDDPDEFVLEALPRREVVRMVLELSEVIRDIEVRRDRVETLMASLAASDAPPPGTPEFDQHEAERDEIEALGQELFQEEAELREIINSLLRVPDIPVE
ncbi:MAG: hypothetical protein ACRDKA_02105 [Actinomycetota bacterium]